MPRRSLQIILVLLVGFSMLGASSPDRRFDKLGHNLMCTCGCGQILLECNHVGCPVSGPMIAELHNQLAMALPNAGVLNWFIAKYGPTVLASPTLHGFDLVAWIMPFAALLLGIAGVVALVRLWHGRHRAQLTTATPVGAAPSPLSDTLRERIRRDTTFDS